MGGGKARLQHARRAEQQRQRGVQQRLLDAQMLAEGAKQFVKRDLRRAADVIGLIGCRRVGQASDEAGHEVADPNGLKTVRAAARHGDEGWRKRRQGRFLNQVLHLLHKFAVRAEDDRGPEDREREAARAHEFFASAFVRL
jgi:hypothetical protein